MTFFTSKAKKKIIIICRQDCSSPYTRGGSQPASMAPDHFSLWTEGKHTAMGARLLSETGTGHSLEVLARPAPWQGLFHFRLCQRGFQDPQELSSEKTAKAESSCKQFLVPLTFSRLSVQMSSRRFMCRRWALPEKAMSCLPARHRGPTFILSENSEVSKFQPRPCSPMPEAPFCSLRSLWPRESWQLAALLW